MSDPVNISIYSGTRRIEDLAWNRQGGDISSLFLWGKRGNRESTLVLNFPKAVEDRSSYLVSNSVNILICVASKALLGADRRVAENRH